MRSKFTNNSGSNQFRWVILLLAVAVILPTICLLWFMMQAVKNERFAVRQKLVEVYYGNLQKITSEKLAKAPLDEKISIFSCDGMLTYNSLNNCVFPMTGNWESIDSHAEKFVGAYKYEYKDNDANSALAEYQRISKAVDSNTVKIIAEIGEARCLHKLNQTDKASSKLQEVISKYDDRDMDLRIQKYRARMMSLDFNRQKGDANFQDELFKTFDFIGYGSFTIDPNLNPANSKASDVPSALQIFVLTRCIDYADSIKNMTPQQEKKFIAAKKYASFLSNSISAAKYYPQPSFVEPNVAVSPIIALDMDEKFYGLYHVFNGSVSLMIFTNEHVREWFREYLDETAKLPSICRIYDKSDRFVAGDEVGSDKKPFVQAYLENSYFPGWMIELYIDDSAFKIAAGKQAAIYLWTGIIFAVLIVISGTVAGQAIGKQIRLNKLKNDFIATITHELKTPLASVRVLVDTLLEGRCQTQQQADEYLRLISKENKRLCHLIDNFLTFSRMERNKQVFDIAAASPVELANAAADAIRTKFERGNVKFDVDIAKPLPMINADKDAMVTVLINLLDNAYKYSYNDKHIQLKVFTDDGSVCFSVKDNGIGMARRHMRKIFDRFYQVDSSLSRRAEGTGLGLSIVKFIVDAHKGKIDVESKPGKGSEFIVRLPIG